MLPTECGVGVTVSFGRYDEVTTSSLAWHGLVKHGATTAGKNVPLNTTFSQFSLESSRKLKEASHLLRDQRRRDERRPMLFARALPHIKPVLSCRL